MSISKLVGLETEYAITGGEAVRASGDVVRAYPQISLEADETEATMDSLPRNPCVSSFDGSDLMLPNGARFYVDHAHPEYSTPESADPFEVVALDRVGAEIVQRCAKWVNLAYPDRVPLRIYKNNTDHLGNSYGCHENYLVEAKTYAALFGRKAHWLFAYLVPFLVSRIVYTGAGKVAAENIACPSDYQISQRADTFEEVVGPQTTHNRPIVNTRDEPHADSSRFRRLHVIAGDANMCPFATWLKVGTMQIFLRMLEDGALNGNLYLADPILAIKQISCDPSCTIKVRLEDGRELTAIELQMAFLDCAHRYFERAPRNQAESALLQEWEKTLFALRGEPVLLVGKLDWLTKRHIIAELVSQEGWGWSTPQAVEADVKYHALDPAEGIFLALEQMGMILSPPGWDLNAAATSLRDPPRNSRAYLRGSCIARFSLQITSADWERITFRAGDLLLPDPLEMGERSVGSLLANARKPSKLLKDLGRLSSVATTTQGKNYGSEA